MYLFKDIMWTFTRKRIREEALGLRRGDVMLVTVNTLSLQCQPWCLHRASSKDVSEFHGARVGNSRSNQFSVQLEFTRY